LTGISLTSGANRRAFEGLDIQMTMPAGGYTKKHANVGVEKRDTARTLAKPLKMTATQKRRALKKVKKQEAADASRHLFPSRN
jgi:hypothetical protein